MKFFHLARAMFSDNMDLFAYRTKPTDAKLKRLVFPLILGAVVMFSAGYITYALIEPLGQSGQTELIPMFLVILLSVVALLEGIYKAQSILFDCRDNDLLLALPVPKHQIFAVRVAKLLVFQIIYNALFMLPAFAVYAAMLHPGADFYLFSALMLFLTPLIPTAVAVAIGYLIKALSLNFEHKKISQTVLTFIAMMAAMLVMGNWQSLVVLFTDHAATTTEIMSRLYYPAGAYARLIQQFSWLDFLGLMASCILPLIAIVYLCSRRYFKIISKNSANSPEATTGTQAKTGKISLVASSPTSALVKKELSRIAASPVFMVNTLFGPVLLIFATILASVNTDGLLGLLGDGGEGPALTASDISLLAPLFYIGALILMCAMTSITSSMISIEGESFNTTKSLPVSPQKILLSKLLASLVLALPLFFFSDICFIFEFKPTISHILLIIVLPVLVLTLTGLIGLFVNLKYPKLDAISDAEVVKQSASSLISVFVGMGIGIGSVAILVALAIFTPLDAPLILAFAYLLIDLFLLKLLNTKGAKKFMQIEI